MADREHRCDVLVIGSGASGFTAALTARKHGADVLVVEKEEIVGGTSATSGGTLWIPGNPHSPEVKGEPGLEEALASARRYVLAQGGNYIDRDRLDTFLDNGHRMVSFLERETEVRFYSNDYPDYYSEQPEASTLRSIHTVNYRASALGAARKTLKNQLPQMLFLGLAIGSSVEMKEFMRAGRSVKSMGFVVKRMAQHFLDVIRYGHDEQAVRGRALIARMYRSIMDLDIPVWLGSPVEELIREDDRVTGAIVRTADGRVRVTASKGVISACGGYPGDPVRRAATYPPLGSGPNHAQVTPPGNTGDGVTMAEKVGAAFNGDVAETASWMPVSVRPGAARFENVWPHLVDRQKPGFIAVTRHGRRFVDESASYHHFVPPMLRACAGDDEAYAWLISDKTGISRWGMGFVRPSPVPHGRYIRSGYLKKAGSLAELADQTGIDKAQLLETVRAFNENARIGVDPDFNRGGRIYDHYQGDDEVGPNNCLAPLENGPFFAVKIVPSEIGTFAGLRTDVNANVLDRDGMPIAGLYAVGNDQANVFAGTYPGAGSTLGPGMTFAYIAGRHAAGRSDAA